MAREKSREAVSQRAQDLTGEAIAVKTPFMVSRIMIISYSLMCLLLEPEAQAFDAVTHGLALTRDQRLRPLAIAHGPACVTVSPNVKSARYHLPGLR
jgi:hypothetical protein